MPFGVIVSQQRWYLKRLYRFPIAFLLYNLKYVLPFSTLRSVYLALTESYILYEILAWGNATNTYIQQVRMLQTKILRRMIPVNRTNVLNDADVYAFCGVLPVDLIFEYRLLLKFYFSDNYNCFKSTEVSTRARIQGVFKVPSHKNKDGKRTIEYCVSTLYNQLPVNIRNLNNYKIIKSELNRFLHSKLKGL